MMSEQENNTAPNTPEEELEIQVEDQPLEETQTSPDEELDNYTKGVSKRINKLNERHRAAEERAARLEKALAQSQKENEAYRQETLKNQNALIEKEEEALKAKEVQADELYKKAVASGDAELMSKADTLKSDLSIQKEKVRIAKQQAEQTPVAPSTPVEQNFTQPEPQQEIVPTEQAKAWHAKNSWYGDTANPENLQATQYAYFTHYNLINEGYEADSEDYYNELDARVGKVYPDIVSEQSVVQQEDRPAVQRVTSTSVGSRQKTQGKKNGVTFSKAEVERLRGLKPHNMSEEAWLKSVAKEKQKISAREAK
tara:strand:- start:358 stop:1293 length:936 start_codon:yes stop_codon:yes gene_type:complete